MKQATLYTLFFFSGVAGLGYEILWTKMFAVSLGHEIAGMLAVITAFFSGIALGGWVFDKPICRSRFPARWYIAFELVIGLWALALIFIIPAMNPVIASVIGLEPDFLRHWAAAFFFPFLLLLPATASMGGTLAAMDRFFAQVHHGQSTAGLYSANTLGAMAGTLCTTFFIIPAYGLTQASLLLAGINILGAFGAWGVSYSTQPRSVEKQASTVTAPVQIRLYLTLLVTGLLGVGYEVLMIRALNQLLENTVFTFASLLAIYLFGTAAGAAVYQRTTRKNEHRAVLTMLLQATAFFCLVSIYLLQHIEKIFSAMLDVLGPGFIEAVAAEMVLALLVFLLPTMFMGAAFSHLACTLRTPQGGVGKALGLNTIGGAAAPVVFGVWLLPELGLKYVFLIIPAGYLLLTTHLSRRTIIGASPVVAIGLLIVLNTHPYQFTSLEKSESLDYYRDGVMASVSVVHDKKDHVHLKVNNHFQMGGTTSQYSDLRQAQLPLLLHPKPESALFLGLGTGITFSGAADYPNLQADGVELIPEVIQALPYFAKVTGNLEKKDNLNIINADARRYVTTVEKQYDVVVADLFHPARDGAGSLYTVEHFQAIRNILTPKDGLFCQWLPLYQMDLAGLKIIIRSFLEVFPDAQAYLAHYSISAPIIGLVGSQAPLRYPEKWFRTKMDDRVIREKVLQLKYDSFYSLFGTFLAGSEQLKKYTARSPLNTDDTSNIVFHAPHFVYTSPAPPHERLLQLVHQLSPAQPKDILIEYITEEDYLAQDRIQAYWEARNRFLEIGIGIDRTEDVRKLYETARKPLLSVVRKSFDFSAAYYPLLYIAYEIFPYDQDASYQLLSELIRANPMRSEAFMLRSKMFDR